MWSWLTGTSREAERAMDRFATSRRNDVELMTILAELGNTLSRFDNTLKRARKKFNVSG